MVVKTGYLKEDFRLFHLSDQREWACPFHYHDFDKITIFLQGKVTYDIEGTTYTLQPYDIIAIPAGQIHRPVISGGTVYERIIAYLSPTYLDSFARRGFPISPIFHAPSPVLRQEMGSVYSASCRLRHTWNYDGAAGTLLQEAAFTEFLVHLAAAVKNKEIACVRKGRQNEKILAVMSYIAAHLKEPLTVSSIANACFVSPDYLMHLFKEETGLTLGHYVTTKRLQKARRLIGEGRALTTVCYDCGFKNYSTFYRAWKKQYHSSPKTGTASLDDTFEE